jgi:hypothetical protein
MTQSMELQAKEELTALWATCTALRSMTGNKAKGEYLLTVFTERPFVRAWFRIVYDGALQYPLTMLEFLRNATTGHAADRVPLRRAFKAVVDGDITKMQFHYNLIYYANAVVAQELRSLIGLALDRDLQCGVDVPLLNKVLARQELPPMVELPDRQYNIIISTDGNFSHNATLLTGNTKLAHIMFEPGVDVRAVLDNICRPSVVVQIPKYAK